MYHARILTGQPTSPARLVATIYTLITHHAILGVSYKVQITPTHYVVIRRRHDCRPLAKRPLLFQLHDSSASPASNAACLFPRGDTHIE